MHIKCSVHQNEVLTLECQMDMSKYISVMIKYAEGRNWNSAICEVHLHASELKYIIV